MIRVVIGVIIFWWKCIWVLIRPRIWLVIRRILRWNSSVRNVVITILRCESALVIVISLLTFFTRDGRTKNHRKKNNKAAIVIFFDHFFGVILW